MITSKNLYKVALQMNLEDTRTKLVISYRVMLEGILARVEGGVQGAQKVQLGVCIQCIRCVQKLQWQQARLRGTQAEEFHLQLEAMKLEHLHPSQVDQKDDRIRPARELQSALKDLQWTVN